MKKDHALLSPSGASRWLACTPSARLEESFPSSTNPAAEEGTFAHYLSELYLRNHFKMIKSVIYNTELKKAKNSQYYNAELNGHCQEYVNFIVDKYNSMIQAMIFIEEKIDLTEYVPEGFGTGDCILIADGLLDLNDLKYGKGVLVEAKENKQLMLYALGSLKKYSLMYHIDRVQVTIYQPRLDNYSSYEISAKDLLKWGDQYVKPRAQLAFDGEGEYVPGDHCKFCKARNSCKALADHHMSLAKYAFEDPNKLKDQDISDILEKAQSFTSWLSDIQSYALQQAVYNDKVWPGFKLVAGRSNRKYANEEAIIKSLKKAKIDSALFMTDPKLVGIGTLEKNIGKAEVEKYCGKYIIKPPGAATLVPEWDKRPALSSAEAAKEAFSEINNQ